MRYLVEGYMASLKKGELLLEAESADKAAVLARENGMKAVCFVRVQDMFKRGGRNGQ